MNKKEIEQKIREVDAELEALFITLKASKPMSSIFFTTSLEIGTANTKKTTLQGMLASAKLSGPSM